MYIATLIPRFDWVMQNVGSLISARIISIIAAFYLPMHQKQSTSMHKEKKNISPNNTSHSYKIQIIHIKHKSYKIHKHAFSGMFTLTNIYTVHRQANHNLADTAARTAHNRMNNKCLKCNIKQHSN